MWSNTFALSQSITHQELEELSALKLFNESICHVNILNSSPENSQTEIPLSQSDFEQIIMGFGTAPLKFQLILFYILCRSGQSVSSKILQCWTEHFIAQIGFQINSPDRLRFTSKGKRFHAHNSSNHSTCDPFSK